jgi:hypothetical protein
VALRISSRLLSSAVVAPRTPRHGIVGFSFRPRGGVY